MTGMGVLSSKVNWPKRIAEHSYPSGSEVKNEWSSISTLNEGITMCLEIKYYNTSVRQHNLIIYL